jgi:hypothetical protein
MGNSPFSRRHRFRQRREINVRADAPEALRAGLLTILSDFCLNYSDIRAIVCAVLHVFPDQNNWTEIPNVRDEVRELVQGCDWYRVYDIGEASYQSLIRSGRQEEFAQQLNALFEDLGIGWQMIDGQIVTRGDVDFERVVAQAVQQIDVAGLRTPKTEIEEARADLSRRPEPDITGTVQHCMAALECVARVVSNEEGTTLGRIVQRHAAQIGLHRALANATENLWGYASDMARHVQEGREPSREEAELLLSMCASLITYLLQRLANRGN